MKLVKFQNGSLETSHARKVHIETTRLTAPLGDTRAHVFSFPTTHVVICSTSIFSLCIFQRGSVVFLKTRVRRRKEDIAGVTPFVHNLLANPRRMVNTRITQITALVRDVKRHSNCRQPLHGGTLFIVGIQSRGIFRKLCDKKKRSRTISRRSSVRSPATVVVSRDVSSSFDMTTPSDTRMDCVSAAISRAPQRHGDVFYRPFAYHYCCVAAKSPRSKSSPRHAFWQTRARTARDNVLWLCPVSRGRHRCR